MKQDKIEAYDVKETKKQKQKNLDQGFYAEVCVGFYAEVCVHIHKPTYAGQLFAYAYFELACTYRIMCAQTCLRNPNPET